MKLLKELYKANYLVESDKSGVSFEKLDEIRKLIKKGAENTGKWPNALALVDKAYTGAKVQIPSTDMVSAWKDYEKMVQYAVAMLTKYHGIDGEWRDTTSALIPESFEVVLYNDAEIISEDVIDYITKEDLIEGFKQELGKITINETDNGTELNLWSLGSIKSKNKILIKQSEK
jgi:hypothetical protein